jgi:hypothetical protein
MDSRDFAKSIEKQVGEFCKNLDDKLPAYSFIPLTTDEMRIKVMQSRLFNEIRAGEIFGGWLKSTPELDVKKTLAEATHEEYEHAGFLEEALRSKGATPYDYQPLPAQMAMFNSFEGLTDTVERIAAFPMAGEGVADYLIAKSRAGSQAHTNASTKTKPNTATIHSIFWLNTPPRQRSRSAPPAPSP